MEQFRQNSIQITNQIPIGSRKREGIFFTPKCIRDVFIDIISPRTISSNILEPSFGSGEFIQDLVDNGFMNITGIEKNAEVFKNFNNNLNLIMDDYLDYDFGTTRFDIIIGNPPYFQIPPSDKKKYTSKYKELLGKFDIYLIFILKSLSLLLSNGILLFVIPKTFINTPSYNKVRELIYNNFTIDDVINFEQNDWIDTKQTTIGLIVRNTKPTQNNSFGIFIQDLLIINSKKSINILRYYSQLDTIGSMGFKIRTGEIVCTDSIHKLEMTSDPTKSILIHNSQIRNNNFVFTQPRNSNRPLYIDYDKEPLSETVILVNRGNGNNGNLRFEFCLLNPNDYQNPIQIENHLYKIYDNGNNDLTRLFQSLCNPKTLEFITNANGTGSITAQFLRIIPFF